MRPTGSIEEIMRVRPHQHGSWLFPVMVVAATCVVAFGALGLAVVTGHMRGKHNAPGAGDNLVTAEAAGPIKGASVVNEPDASAGITANIGRN